MRWSGRDHPPPTGWLRCPRLHGRPRRTGPSNPRWARAHRTDNGRWPSASRVGAMRVAGGVATMRDVARFACGATCLRCCVGTQPPGVRGNAWLWLTPCRGGGPIRLASGQRRGRATPDVPGNPPQAGLVRWPCCRNRVWAGHPVRSGADRLRIRAGGDCPRAIRLARGLATRGKPTDGAETAPSGSLGAGGVPGPADGAGAAAGRLLWRGRTGVRVPGSLFPGWIWQNVGRICARSAL